MGSKQPLDGVYAREASIQIGFQWEGRRHKERVALNPTASNLRAAARLRDEIISAIKIGKFTLDDFALHFPHSTWLKKRLNPIGSSSVAIPGGRTLRDVSETWFTITKGELEDTTLKEYRNTMQRYFLPMLGDKDIARIDYEDLALLLASHKISNAKTFNNAMTPLRRVFAYARKTRKISTDITADIECRKVQAATPDPLELDEIDLILEHLRGKRDDRWLNYFEFAFFTGMRPSELIALKWENVDFRRGKIRVDAARVRAIDKQTKTKRSRDVDLQTRALAALTRQKKHTFMANDFVFTNPETGTRLFDTQPPVEVFRSALKALGIRRRDARQARHTFATMCLHAQMNPAYVSRQMGHVDPQMFFRVYSKWMDGEASDRERAKLDALFTAHKRAVEL
jgi:integrase